MLLLIVTRRLLCSPLQKQRNNGSGWIKHGLPFCAFPCRLMSTKRWELLPWIVCVSFFEGCHCQSCQKGFDVPLWMTLSLWSTCTRLFVVALSILCFVILRSGLEYGYFPQSVPCFWWEEIVCLKFPYSHLSWTFVCHFTTLLSFCRFWLSYTNVWFLIFQTQSFSGNLAILCVCSWRC